MKGKLSMKKLFKSILTIMLSLVMVITLMPMNAHAATLTNFNKLVAGTTSITLDDNDATRADALAFINANYAADNSYQGATVIFGYNSATDEYIYAYSLSYDEGTHTYSFNNASYTERTLSSFMADVNLGIYPADIYVIGTLSSGYTVTFNANGHGTAPTAITGLSSGSTITEPTAPTETGYTFGGWYKEAACTNAWNFTSDTVTANTELFAKWNTWTALTAATTSISLDDENITSATALSVAQSSGIYSDYYVVYAKSGDNYNVAQYNHNSGNPFFSSPSTKSLTELKALLSGGADVYVIGTISEAAAPTTYTVTFHANGGTGTHTAATGVSGTYTLPTTTTFTAPSGKVFDGWSETLGGSKISGTTITVSQNIDLYAVWSDPKCAREDHNHTYVISGSGDNKTLTITATGSNKTIDSYCGLADDSGIITQNGIKKVVISDGITDIGQFTFQNCNTVTSVELPSGLLHIWNYAFYGCYGLTSLTIPNTVTTVETCAFKKCIGLTSVTFTNTVGTLKSDAFTGVGTTNGLEATSTSTNKKSTPVVLNVPSTWSNLPDANNIWCGGYFAVPTTYTVTFNANGHGTAPSAISGITSGSTITAPLAPSETGYTFGGWYKEAACTNAWNFASDTVTANTELFAKWTPAALVGTVTINGNTKYHNTLTANVTGDNNTGTLSYQWKSNGSNVGTDSQYYLPQASDIGNTITVTVTSTVQTGSIISSATATIEKEDGPSAPSVTAVACTTAANNDGKITGTTTNMEYDTSTTFSSPTDCSATETTGLVPGTYYVRLKETNIYKAGAYATVVINAYSVPLGPTTYTVSFDANGGSGTHADVTGVSGPYTLPTTTTFIAPSGKTFDGWSETSGGTKIATTTILVTSAKTLYAVWKDVPTPTPTPAPSTPSEGSSSGSSEASTPSTETKTEVVPVNYSVVKGDTLNKIAKRNGLTLNEFLALNPQIKNPNMIYVGQIITIGTTTREVNEKETKAPVTSTKEYIVVKGDSLSRIARRNNISLKELIAKNPQITNINMIYIGQKINL